MDSADFPSSAKRQTFKGFRVSLISGRGAGCISPMSTVWAFSLLLISYRHNGNGFSSRTALLVFLTAGTRICDKGAPLKLGTAGRNYGKHLIVLTGCPSDSSPGAPIYPFIPLVRKTCEGLPTPEKPFPLAIFYESVGKREFWIGEINIISSSPELEIPEIPAQSAVGRGGEIWRMTETSHKYFYSPVRISAEEAVFENFKAELLRLDRKKMPNLLTRPGFCANLY